MEQKQCRCYAQASDTQRQEMWKRIFPPDGRVPISPPLPFNAELAGERSLAYLIDFERVSPASKAMLIKEMATKFGLPEERVAADIEDSRAPVKADGVIVIWCPLHSRMAM